MTSPAGSPVLPRHRWAFVVMVLIWSTTWRAIHWSHEGFAPSWGAALRFWLAAACMAAISGPARWRAVPPGPAVLLGLMGYTVNYTCSYAAVALMPSGTAAVLFATNPLLTALWARWLVPGSRLTTRTLAGLLLALGGMVVIRGGMELPSTGLAAALTVVVVGTNVQAFTTVWMKRAAAGVDVLGLNAWAMAAGAVGLSVVALVREGSPQAMLAQAPVSAWLAVGYLAVAGTCVTFTIFYRLVQVMGPVTPSTAGILCPVLALLFGALVGGEPLTAWHVGGAALTVGGVALAIMPAASRP